MAAKVSRVSVHLSAYLDLVVIYLAMKLRSLRGIKTILHGLIPRRARLLPKTEHLIAPLCGWSRKIGGCGSGNREQPSTGNAPVRNQVDVQICYRVQPVLSSAR